MEKQKEMSDKDYASMTDKELLESIRQTQEDEFCEKVHYADKCNYLEQQNATLQQSLTEQTEISQALRKELVTVHAKLDKKSSLECFAYLDALEKAGKYESALRWIIGYDGNQHTTRKAEEALSDVKENE